MRLLITFLVLAYTSNVKAQKNVLLEFGGSLLYYTGDMGSFDQAGGGFKIGILFTKKERLNSSFHFIVGSVSDDDPSISTATQIGDINPNRYFKTMVTGVNYALNYNFLKNKRWQIYISQGLGFLRFNPKNESGEELTSMEATRNENEDYRTTILYLPSKIGVIYFLSKDIGLGASFSSLNTLTDYLDNRSTLADTGNDNIFQSNISIFFRMNSKEKSNL